MVLLIGLRLKCNITARGLVIRIKIFCTKVQNTWHQVMGCLKNTLRTYSVRFLCESWLLVFKSESKECGTYQVSVAGMVASCLGFQNWVYRIWVASESSVQVQTFCYNKPETNKCQGWCPDVTPSVWKLQYTGVLSGRKLVETTTCNSTVAWVFGFYILIWTCCLVIAKWASKIWAMCIPVHHYPWIFKNY